MSTIGKLLGSSPFGLLQRHMDQVAKCVAKMSESFLAVLDGNWADVEQRSSEASKLEHQADQIKDEIRNKLLRRFFMPVDRSQILEILSIQDGLADTAEDVAVLLTIRQMVVPQQALASLRQFHELNKSTFDLARNVIADLDELVESGFGGAEAEKVRNMVQDVAYKEHQVDVLQRTLLKILYSDEAQLSAADLSLWLQLIRAVGRLSNLSENLADRVQMTLDLK